MRHDDIYTPKSHHISSNNVLYTENLFASQIQSDIKSALEKLRHAKKLYENSGNEFGKGKTNLALAEFYVEDIYGARVSSKIN